MREIVHLQAGQCGNQIGAKVSTYLSFRFFKCELLLKKFERMEIVYGKYANQKKLNSKFSKNVATIY